MYGNIISYYEICFDRPTVITHLNLTRIERKDVKNLITQFTSSVFLRKTLKFKSVFFPNYQIINKKKNNGKISTKQNIEKKFMLMYACRTKMARNQAKRIK